MMTPIDEENWNWKVQEQLARGSTVQQPHIISGSMFSSLFTEGYTGSMPGEIKLIAFAKTYGHRLEIDEHIHPDVGNLQVDGA
eukprot:6225838-Amphidinium_carterae.2